MKTWVYSTICIGCGVLLGLVLGLWRSEVLLSPVEMIASTKPVDDPRMPELPPASGAQPKVVVDQEKYNFGQMQRFTAARHAFVFKNEGDYPLRLSKGESSCQCTMSDLAKTEIPPGESGEVVLDWTVKSAGDVFRQTATIFTNDPEHRTVTLTIEGQVVESLSVSPHEIVISNLTRNEEGQAKAAIYSELDKPLEIVGHQFENQENADYFSASYHPIPSDKLPPNKKSGCELLIRVKPGLPAGDIRQTIRLSTNLEGVPEPAIPISARVGSPVLLVGPTEWNADRGVLMLGTVNQSTGATREMKLMIRGPRRKTVKLQTPRVEPGVLQATLGEPRDLGSVVAVPLTITIPAGTPAMNHLGSKNAPTCEITIGTDDPDIGDVQVKVSFAVAG